MRWPPHIPNSFKNKVTEKLFPVTKKASKLTENKKKAAQEHYSIRIEEEILDAEQTATILNSSKKVVERELREGRITGYKRLGKWFVLKSDLIRYIREAETE